MLKKILSSILPVALLVLVPTLAHANINSNIVSTGNLTANTDNNLQVAITGLPVDTSALQSEVRFVNVAIAKITTFSVNENGAWINVPLTLSGQDLVGRFNYFAPTLNFKIRFNAAGTYVFSYTIQNLSGATAQVLSSTAYPLQVQAGAQVLGAMTLNSNLRQGQSGTAVRQLQQILKDGGFFNFRVTGYFGPITLAAVKAFQKAHNLPVTGAVDTQTRAALNQ